MSVIYILSTNIVYNSCHEDLKDITNNTIFEGLIWMIDSNVKKASSLNNVKTNKQILSTFKILQTIALIMFNIIPI